MIYIILSPNFSSPIWWMGFIYSVELVVLIVKFGIMHKGDWHSGFSNALGVISFLLALIAPLMIGSVFGITESRVTYFGPMMSVYSLVLGLLSGTALFLLYSMIFHRVTGDGAVESQTPLYNEFTTIFGYVAGIAVLFRWSNSPSNRPPWFRNFWFTTNLRMHSAPGKVFTSKSCWGFFCRLCCC